MGGVYTPPQSVIYCFGKNERLLILSKAANIMKGCVSFGYAGY